MKIKLHKVKFNYFDIGMAYLSFALFYMLAFLVFDWETMKRWLLDALYLFMSWAYYTGMGKTVFQLSDYFRKKKFHASTKNRDMVICSILIYLYTLLTILFFDLGITRPMTENSEIFWKSMFIRAITSTLISVFYIIKNYKQVIEENAELNVKLKGDLQKESEKTAKAQLNALKLQLDPHFMFNSLNTLLGLIDENTKRAEDFTLELSRIYKYIVANINQNTISLKAGMDFIRNYCKLIEIRYPQHFQIEVEAGVAKDEEKERILPLSLQLLVENAIKHNQHSIKSPLRIQIKREGNYICVSNTLHPYPDQEKEHVLSMGIGMKNLYDRYKLISDKIPIALQSDSEYIVKIPII